jgi:REP element-mobilizing transposase RayT/uncharacterized protein YerC
MNKNRNNNYDCGYMHITNRGVGKHIIFEDDNDYKCFIHLLHNSSDKYNVDICAYCLMDNHFHLLIHFQNDLVSDFMHVLEFKYAKYFNAKYERTGHLFQNRFYRKMIEDESYFLTCFRYIIRNPEKAGICSTDRYRWHSLYDAAGINRFCDISLAISLCGGVEQLRKFLFTDNDDECFDYDDEGYTDESAIEFIKKRYCLKSIDEVGAMDKKSRNEFIIDMVENGITYRQIQRITGISRTTVSNVIKNWSSTHGVVDQ